MEGFNSYVFVDSFCFHIDCNMKGNVKRTTCTAAFGLKVDFQILIMKLFNSF